MAFSENLQYIRTQAGITQEQLAEQLEVSRQSVSKWESGASFPEMDTLLRICDLYDVNLDTLLRGSVEESNVSDTAQYDTFMNQFSIRIAFSVGGIIAAVALMVMQSHNAAYMGTMAVTVMLAIISICAVTIIASSIQMDYFRKRHPVIADFYAEEQKDAFHQKFIWYIAGGMGAILFGVVLLVFFGSFAMSEVYESLLSAGFLFIIAAAVTAFIYAGIQEDKYKVWKYNRDNNPTPEAKKRLNMIGTACGCIMLLATAVYVALGFIRDAWGIAWWVFPVGGILCGIVSVALNPYKGEDD